MSNLIVFEALAVFAIWMQRHKRWSLFIGAATGKLVVEGSSKTSTQLVPISPSANTGPGGGLSPAPFLTPNPAGGGLLNEAMEGASVPSSAAASQLLGGQPLL